MSKPNEKKRALSLRRQGKSVGEIAETLGVSRGTVSVWCRDVVLTNDQKRAIKQRQIRQGQAGRQRGADANKKRKIESQTNATDWARKRLTKLSERDLLMLGIGLYWGEGTKQGPGPASLVNSDAQLLQIGKTWLTSVFDLESEDFRPYIFISSDHTDRGNSIVAYWSKQLHLDRGQFHIIYLKQKHTKHYENRDSYYGACALRIRRSTIVRYKILALIERVCELEMTGKK